MRSVSLALVLAALWTFPLAAPIHAQERDRRERRPPTDTVQRPQAPPDTLPGQARGPALDYDPADFSLELDIGLPGSGDAQRQPARVSQREVSGTVLDSAALTRTLTVRGGVYAGVGGVVGLGRDWAARLAVGVATARVETSYRGEDPDSLLIQAANRVPGTRADLTVLSVETGLRWRIPSTRRLRPYVELGAAWTRWNSRGTLPTALQDDLGDRFEALAGVGGVIPLSDRFSAHLHATTRLLRTPVTPRASGDTLGTRLSPGWPPGRKDRYRSTVLVADAPNRSAFADGALEILRLLRLQIGLRWDLHTPTEAREPRPVPTDTTAAPGR